MKVRIPPHDHSNAQQGGKIRDRNVARLDSRRPQIFRSSVAFPGLATGPGDSAGGSGTGVLMFTGGNEARATITGQAEIAVSSEVRAAVRSDDGDVGAQDWYAPTIYNVQQGSGFTVVLRCAHGTYTGPVAFSWGWQ